MVVVDDANQLTELHYLLELSADSQRHHFIKIIITVRDYAREKLLKAIRTVLIPAQYEVHALSDDNIMKVLSDNLGIQNDNLLEQIKLMPKVIFVWQSWLECVPLMGSLVLYEMHLIYLMTIMLI